jgi:uncharacterized SAM-binding protein YcdF (DUF218 family)
VIAALLQGRGIPDACILLEETGTDTLSSARTVVALVRSRGVRGPVFAASSLYHLPRCLLLLRLLGIPARAAIPPIVSAGNRWWLRCYWWLREVPAVPYDGLLAILSRIRRSHHG